MLYEPTCERGYHAILYQAVPWNIIVPGTPAQETRKYAMCGRPAGRPIRRCRCRLVESTVHCRSGPEVRPIPPRGIKEERTGWAGMAEG